MCSNLSFSHFLPHERSKIQKRSNTEITYESGWGLFVLLCNIVRRSNVLIIFQSYRKSEENIKKVFSLRNFL